MLLILALLLPTAAVEAQSNPSELQLAFEPSLDSSNDDLLAIEALAKTRGETGRAEYEVGEGLDVFLNEHHREDHKSHHLSAISPLSSSGADRNPDGLYVSPFIGTGTPRYGYNKERAFRRPSAGPYDSYYSGAAGLGILLDRGVWASFAYGTGDELPGLTYESDIEGVAFDESERLLFGLHFYY
jgi:hypothetical protein